MGSGLVSSARRMWWDGRLDLSQRPTTADQLRSLLHLPTRPGVHVITVVGATITRELDLDCLTRDQELVFVGCHLLGGLSARRVRLRALRIERGIVSGPSGLVLDHAVVDGPVELTDRSSFTGIGADHARLGGLSLRDSSVSGARGIAARAAHVCGDLRVAGWSTIVVGGLQMERANVEGHVVITGRATIGDAKGTGRSLDLSDATGGMLTLTRGAHLTGSLNLNGSRWSSQILIEDRCRIGRDGSHRSLTADGIDAASDIVLRGDGTTLRGGVRLHGGHVAGQLVIRDGVSVGHDDEGNSVHAGAAVIDQEMFIQGSPPAPQGGPTRRCSLAGAVDLLETTVGGAVHLRPPLTIGRNHFGTSLFADRARITGDVRIEPRRSTPATVAGPQDGAVVFDGTIRLADALIGGSMTLRGDVTVRADPPAQAAAGHVVLERYGIVAPGVSVTRDVVLDGSHVDLRGGIRMTGGSVGGGISVSAARIGASATGVALEATSATVGRDLSLAVGARIEGAVCVDDATLQGAVEVSHSVTWSATPSRLSLVGATCTGLEVVAPAIPSSLDLTASTIDHLSITRRGTAPAPPCQITLVGATIGTLALRGATGRHQIDLRQCTVGQLADDVAFWTDGRRSSSTVARRWWSGDAGDPSPWIDVHLGDLRVDRTPDDEAMPGVARLLWLRHGSSLGPQPEELAASRASYRQVARAQAASGAEVTSTSTLMEMRRRHMRSRLARWALEAIGQGYRPTRAIWILLLLGVTAVTLAHHAHASGNLRAADGGALSRRCGEEPCLELVTFGLDTVVPILSLDETDTWRMAPDRSVVSVVTAYRWSFILLRIGGAALTALFVLGATNKVLDRRDTA